MNEHLKINPSGAWLATRTPTEIQQHLDSLRDNLYAAEKRVLKITEAIKKAEIVLGIGVAA